MQRVSDSEGDTDDDLENFGSGDVESRILGHATRLGGTYMQALNSLRAKKAISEKERSKYDLSLPEVRGTEIHVGYCKMGQFCSNEYQFRVETANEMGIPPFEIGKERSKYGRIDLARGNLRGIVGMCGLLLRKEERYICKETDYRELYYRKCDHMNLLGMLMMDHLVYGTSPHVVSSIRNLAAKIAEPSCDVQCVTRDLNENSNSSDTTVFEVQWPLSDLYKSYRAAIGWDNLDLKGGIIERLGRGEVVYADSGACLNYNLKSPEAHHIVCCDDILKNRYGNNSEDLGARAGHRKSHFCMLCLKKGHPYWQCQPVRAVMSRAAFNSNWKLMGFENENLSEKKRFSESKGGRPSKKSQRGGRANKKKN